MMRLAKQLQQLLKPKQLVLVNITILHTAYRRYTNMVEDEIALYDRQIRLWGVQAQEK